MDDARLCIPDDERTSADFFWIFIGIDEPFSVFCVIIVAGYCKTSREKGCLPLYRAPFSSITTVAGEIRLTMDPLDLLRALAGGASISRGPAWRVAARQLIGILITDMRAGR
ncbi:hypothetical protein FHT82_004695 [Rhizobium sp. BK275]|nr:MULTISPECIES: hypothetical protein [unclassified Rhizobium]MBB3391917.1 hypothetical protein [Rhizobium sp. BK275]MBB3410323.1 hypothetical protein [Rhizobium sp. BK316]